MALFDQMILRQRRSEILTYLGIFLIYLLLRLLAWSNASDLEDHDSVGLLLAIQPFARFDFQGVIDLGPDTTPFYPAFGALFSLMTESVEIGARVCSLFFSCVLFVAVIGIGRRFATPFEVGLGLFILSFNPILIRLSYSVLTEPSYISVVYLGFWFFLNHYKRPSVASAIVLGVLFSLAFLNRIEGILYLAAIPALQIIHYFLDRQRAYTARALVAWAAVFLLTFTALSAPQVWRVSEEMGSVALNGRQIWSLIMSSPDGKSYNDKIYGLAYSEEQINLDYLQDHPAELERSASTSNILTYMKLASFNLDDLSRHKAAELIGLFGLMFFGIGFLALFSGRQQFEVFLLGAFICIGVVAPLLHNVVLRHIAVVAPLIMMVAGVGVARFSKTLSGG